MLPTLAQVCSLKSEFAVDVAEFAAGKCFSLELWLTKLEDYLRANSVEDVRRLLAEHQMAVPVASYQGGLLVSQGEVSLTQVAQLVGQAGLRAAIEFQAQAAFGNNLQTAAALVQEVGSPHLGLCLDLFHFYVGPSKLEDLGYLSTANLFRILPGEGDIPLRPILDRLREISYEGCISIELFNPHIWEVGPRQFGEIAMTSLRKLL
jgi:4-hydroxyphenylpyruvate dioxygenase